MELHYRLGMTKQYLDYFLDHVWCGLLFFFGGLLVGHFLFIWWVAYYSDFTWERFFKEWNMYLTVFGFVFAPLLIPILSIYMIVLTFRHSRSQSSYRAKHSMVRLLDDLTIGEMPWDW